MDAAGRRFACRPARALHRPSTSLPFARRRPDVEDRQSRPHSRPAKNAPANLDAPTLADSAGLAAPRRRLLDRPVADASAGAFGREPTTATFGSRAMTGRSWRNVTPRAAHAMEQGRHRRSFALQHGNRIRRDRPSPPRRLSSVHLPHDGRRHDLDADRPRHSRRFVRQRRARRSAGTRACSTPVRSAASTFRSTTATTGRRFSEISRSHRFAISTCTATTSSSRRTAAHSGSWTTLRRFGK